MTVQIILGSINDREVAAAAEKVLKELGVPYQTTIASAHRSPVRVESIVKSSKADVFIAIAGLTNALAGVVGALTIKPVIGVPLSGKLSLDSLFSVTQLPPGMPVAAVGLDRGENAGHLAAQMLAIKDPELQKKLLAYKKKLADKVETDAKTLEASA
jgi:5-(carboxyamino)imidazole ribonucleotide mutase